jgi:hypothetical protein
MIIRFSQRIINFWSQQLEYTRNDSYPNACRSFSVTVRDPQNAQAPFCEVVRTGAIVPVSATFRGTAIERQRRHRAAYNWATNKVSDYSHD